MTVIDRITHFVKDRKIAVLPLLQRASASNSCMIPSTSDINSERVRGWIKDKLKRRRPFFRLIYGYRALRHGMMSWIRGKRGAKAYMVSSVSFLTGSDTVAGRPMNVTLEPTNACNLGCPVCETGARTLERPTEHMSVANFQTIVDKIAHFTNTLLFYYMGEPFLNRNAYEMIRYAKSKGIPLITTCTNGDFVDAEKVVLSGLDEISFQIGGMTQETHEIYRINSNLSRVLANLKATVDARNRHKSKMRIGSGFILMKHNEHEVPLFQKTMAEWGVDQPIVIDPCVRTYEQGLLYLPTDKKHWFYDSEAFAKQVLKPQFLPPNECPWLYYALTIHVNGNVVPCCRDPRGEHIMGNILTESMDEVWNGTKFREFRRNLHQDQSKISICRLCSSYSPPPLQ